MRNMNFLGWPIVTGVLIAVIILQFFPNMFAPPVTTVEIRETTADTPHLGNGPISYADAVETASPAVVNIYTQHVVKLTQHPMVDDPTFKRFFDLGDMPQRERIQSSLGSGVILNQQGYIITNNHVIAGADRIVVALKDGREAPAKIVGTDPETDLAILKTELKQLPSITLSSSDSLRVGDVVLAIGNPFGVGQTVTMGIVSATGRNGLGLNTYEDFLQTDAAINPGNSGGALVDAIGNLVGINTAIFSKSGGSQGIGFAIPSSLAKKVMTDLIEHGRVIRGWLGIEIQELTPRLAESFGLEDVNGLIIAGIYKDGPSHQAGLQPGDIMLTIDGKPVEGRKSMIEIADVKPGTKLPIEFIRNGKRYNTNIIVGERPLTRPG
ncbi:trypsin-like peptidase domain-containing protein [Neptunomonas sp. XY-337]|uniref:trypsin-like peptidase domain-containing protein n=1 Tax=Neptunomonas sp. XY-337 TaxID=2561897 RepID=UPI0023EF53DB|nr:trypsin-like peptidase domain-containing protein [Neptunomonas sp. XY-337]